MVNDQRTAAERNTNVCYQRRGLKISVGTNNSDRPEVNETGSRAESAQTAVQNTLSTSGMSPGLDDSVIEKA